MFAGKTKWLLKCFILSNVITLASCSSLTDDPIKVDYQKAMDRVRASITKDGIPRTKVLAYFMLSDAPSSRSLNGGRGGFTNTSERWDLACGYKLEAYKHVYLGDKWILKPHNETRAGLTKMRNHFLEPKPEPFFDTLYLVDRREKYSDEIRLPYNQ